MIQIHRFLDEIEGALFHRGDGFFDRAICGDENDGKVGSTRRASRNTSMPELPGSFKSERTSR